MAKTAAEKILARLKGLDKQMREGERPLFSLPAIWENATERQSNACDLVLTNRRLFGYIYTTFPRERLFLDALELDAITTVSVRQKNFEALFRELLVSDGKKRVYIRATRQKIEQAYTALREAIAEYAPATQTALAAGEPPAEQTTLTGAAEYDGSGPTYTRQQVRQPLERSPLGITLLLVGGLILEVIGVLVWATSGSAQTGIPLLLAGIVAVVVAIMARRQMR
jgi:hypothetical protein